MNLIDRAIEAPRLVILGVALLCILGLYAIFTLPKERTPRIKLPVIVVAVPNPGSSPSTNESQIIRKIEEAAGSLTGLKEQGGILAHAMNNLAVVQFVFNEGFKSTESKRDVESLINKIKGEFPPNAQQNPGPIVTEVTFDQFPIIQIFIAGGGDGQQRRRIAERMRPLIDKVEGIASVDIFGGLEREVQIEVDPHRMALYGFTYAQIESAIRRANLEAPSGAIQTSAGTDQNVRTQTKLASLEEIAQVPLGAREGKPLLLADLAKVSMGHKPVKSLARFGGQDAAVLLVHGKNDIDVLAAANHVQKVVDDFVASKAGEDTHIGTVRSQAREINYMLKEIGTDAWQGMLLLVAVLWVVFGWRNATLISISLPFSIIVMAAFMWLAKHTFMPDMAINNMTLFAVILVMGEVVDGSIVAGENIYRHRELGRSPVDAAKRGIEEVRTALLASYGTTFAGYSAMFLVRGTMGEYLKLLPIVSIFSLLAAMIGLFFVQPLVSVYLMRQPQKQSAAIASAQVHDQMTEAQREVAYADAEIASSRLKRGYGVILQSALQHRWLVLGLVFGTTLIPVGLFLSGAIGFEFFPQADVPVVEVRFELPLGSSMEKRTAEVAGAIEKAVVAAVQPDEWYRPSSTSPRVKPVTTIGDPGALNIRLDAQDGIGPEFGMVYVELESAEHRRRSAAQIRQAILDALPPLPGVIVRITSPVEGPPAGAPIVLRVLGQSETTHQALAERAAELVKLLSSIPGCRDVTSDYRVRPELVVSPHREVASLFGVDAAQIATSVNYALEGVKVGEVDFGGRDKIELRLRNFETNRSQLRDLTDLPLRSPTGRIVSLDQVADVDRTLNPSVIEHYDRKRVVSVRAHLEPGILADDIKAALVAALRPDLSPAQQRALTIERKSKVLESNDRYTLDFGGENELRDEAAFDLQLALVVAMLANFIILVIKFNRFVQPLIIVFSVPLSLIGVTIAFLLCGLHFSIMAMIGVVAVSGVVVDNAILKVEFINHWRRLGAPMEKAVMYAGLLRIRPILLTTLVTVGGLLPAALNIGGGGEVWVPLSVAFIGGLSFSTVVQLLIVPLMCYTFSGEPKPSPSAPAALVALPEGAG